MNFQTNQQSLEYQPGFTPIYEKASSFKWKRSVKISISSPSFDKLAGQMVGVYVYEINKDYVPLN